MPRKSPIWRGVQSPPLQVSFLFIISSIAAHAHVGCMVSSHSHSSAFMSYFVPFKLDCTT